MKILEALQIFRSQGSLKSLGHSRMHVALGSVASAPPTKGAEETPQWWPSWKDRAQSRF